MIIELFNGWYFFWLLLSAGLIVGLYFLLRKSSTKIQKIVLFSLLAVGLLLHFLKLYIPPYSVDKEIMLRDSWFVNICGANIALFPFLFWSKNNNVKDYMFYIGVLSGVLALAYPEEPLAKSNQLGEILDIIRFYYHHWMLLAVPLLMVLFKLHKLSYKRVFSAPIGLLLLMLFIMLNQIFQSELGFISLRDGDFFDVNYKNASYIWGPKGEPIGEFLAIFCPDFFKTIPVGQYAGQEKYWPWFWMIFPVLILVTPLAFGICMIFDGKNFGKDVKRLWCKISDKIKKKDKTKENLVKEEEQVDSSEEKTEQF